MTGSEQDSVISASLTVGEDEVLVIAVPESWATERVNDLARILDDLGIGGKALVIAGAQLAKVDRRESYAMPKPGGIRPGGVNCA